MNYPAQQVIELSIDLLKPYARTHSRKQIKQIAASIERFGFTNPVLVSDGGEIIAGHGRVEAARLLGRRTVPTLALSHLSEVERRAYVLADNKLALNAGWDKEILAIELQAPVVHVAHCGLDGRLCSSRTTARQGWSMSPASGDSSPASADSSVVLPEPLTPISATRSPGEMISDASAISVRPPRDSATSRNRITGGPRVFRRAPAA